jgi:hypothetical protein
MANEPEPTAGNGYPDGTPVWLRIMFTCLQKFGIATVILLAGGYWVATRVAEPLVTTYQEFIRAQSQVSIEQSATLKGLRDSEIQRVAAIKDASSALKTFQDKAETEHTLMLATQKQVLADHKEFMERLKQP